MAKKLYTPKIMLLFAFLGLFSCDDENETPGIRARISYDLLTAETPYSLLFVDGSGATTVDLAGGNARHKMFQALNYYSTSSISANAHVDAAKLKNMFSNTGNPFTDISTASVSVTGAELNASGVQLRNVVASSRPATEAEAVRAKIEGLFTEIDVASNSVSATASPGVAGKLGSYLVDAKGIEIAQIIQKSLIGALQLDYIGNVLLDEGLNANNSTLVSGKNYTQLEHNWDEAYGLLTLNQVYAQGWTAEKKNTSIIEFAGGSYIWEYNMANYNKIHPAFLRGRAAIVNNDKAELQAQATIIRTEFEKAIASAALGYLDKWKNESTDAARAHAIGEGAGFIYSLRFATIHGADATFSDNILTGLLGSANGFWDLNVTKINAAQDAIKAKFNL
jgi:FlaG/FlaF family flagellin (archaellin)